LELFQTTQAVKSLAAITRERFVTKLWRTLLGLGVGAFLYVAELDPGLEKWGYVFAGILIAGEWALFPIRALAALAQDVVAPAIAAIRKALKGNGT